MQDYFLKQEELVTEYIEILLDRELLTLIVEGETIGFYQDKKRNQYSKKQLKQTDHFYGFSDSIVAPNPEFENIIHPSRTFDPNDYHAGYFLGRISRSAILARLNTSPCGRNY